MEKSIMNNQSIPITDSIEELANFWDNHDLTEFEDQLEIVNEPVFIKNTKVEITLQIQELETIKKIAEFKEVNYIDLIREWVLEKVKIA
jgi:predicted DNA binding CopG/RHH family protein